MVDGMTRGVEAIERIIRAIFGYSVAGPVDCLALYPGRVVSQSSDKTRVDVQLDTERIPSPSNVPLRMGIPGTTVTLNLSQTVRVLIGWESGDPSKPYALLFDTGIGTTRIDIDATTIDLNNGTKGAVRKGDTLNASSQMAGWALVVEGFVNGLAPGTFNPANQFTGVTPANPGNTGQFGETWGASGSVKIGD